ncbi:hypothetical protein EON77_08120, partial [bacterium]
MRTRMARWRAAAFVLLLTATDLALGGADVVFRFVLREHGAGVAGGWALLRLATLSAAATLLLAREKKVYMTAFAVFAAFLITDFALMATNAAGLTPSMMRAALAESQYAGGAVRIFVLPALARAAAGGTIVYLLGIAAHAVGRPAGSRAVALAIAALLGSCVLAWHTAGPTWLPRLVAPPFVAGRELLAVPPHPIRDPVQLAAARGHSQHVVLVIDESVRFDVFAASTPWLHTQAGTHARVTDFGAATAVANCSAEANRALLTGLRDRDLPDREDLALRQATLFDYAAAAGYTTWSLDAQETGGTTPAGLGPVDLAHLTHHVMLRSHGVPEAEADRALAAAIDAATTSSPRSFVIANKRGAHYPYAEALPPDRPRPSSADATYRSAVEWTVDGFFAELLPRLRG